MVKIMSKSDTTTTLNVIEGEPNDLMREIGLLDPERALDDLMYEPVRKIIFTALYQLSGLDLSFKETLRYALSQFPRILKEFRAGHYGVK